MLSLTTACAAAFANRSVRIEPILEIYREATAGSTPWVPIPASKIVSRPVRSFSPVLSKTPVMRLDFELAATYDIKRLLGDKVKVRYRERIADQIFDRFYGFMEIPQKGYSMQEGSIVEVCRVNCYSFSQQLKALDYEKLYIADVLGPSTTSQQVGMIYVLGSYYEISRRYAATDDYLSAVHLFSPNALGPNGLGRARIYNPATGTTYLGGSDFEVYISGADFRVKWLVAGPAVDQEYKFICPIVSGWVVPTSPTYYTTTTPSVPPVQALSNLGLLGSAFRDYTTTEWDIPQIDQSVATYPFVKQLSAAKSKPRIFLRAGSGTTIGTEQFVSQDFTWDYDNGYLYYSSETGSSGTRRIFSDNQYNAADIMHVGAREIYWPQTAGFNNAFNTHMAYLYLAAGLSFDYLTSDDPSIWVTDYRLTRQKGDLALKALLGQVPPNYTVYDLPADNGFGTVGAKLLGQAPSPQYRLTQITAARDRDQAADVYTMVRVLSLISTEVSPWYGDAQGCAADLGNHDLTDWTDPYHIWDKRSSTAATLVTSPSYITLSARPNCAIIERLKSFNVRFEGKLSIFRIKDYHDAQSATGPVEASREYTQPYAVHYAAAGQAITVEVAVSSMSEAGEAGEHPEKFLLEFSNYGAVTAKCYGINTTVDRYALGVAVLADVTPSSGWYSYDAAPTVVDSAYSPKFQFKWRYVPETFLKTWMLNYQSYTAAGADFFWEWQRHRVLQITDVPGLNVKQAQELAMLYLDDVVTRATAQEVDVLYEPRVEFGDTVEYVDPTVYQTGYLQNNRTIIGFKDGGTYDKPSMTLEIADYSA